MTTMKKLSLLVATVLLITACKKHHATAPDPAQLEHYPQTWILTVDEGADRYTFLKTNGAVMYRAKVDRSYSLTQLAIDEQCEFEVNQARTEDGSDLCFTLRLDKNKKIWCGVGLSSNKQEIHMIASTINTTSPDDDTYHFFVRKMPDVNGIKTVVLESVQYPGYYVSINPPGSQFAQNLVTLQKASNPEKATAWQCR